MEVHKESTTQMGARAIVTGATGFIGTALCKELLTHGYEVIAVIRPGSKKREKLETLGEYSSGLQILELSLDGLSELAFQGVKGNVFYHLAWNGSAGDARNQFEAQSVNIQYTTDAIRIAKRCGCSRFIGAGSQAEYGVVHGVAREYETVPNPFMMYGAAKLSAYQMGNLVAQQEEITFVWPRIYSVYGPGENPGTLVNYVIDCLKKGESPQVSECENMWDFTYIDDCVRMLRILGEHPDARGIYNLSAGTERPLKEFVKEIRDNIAPKVEIAFGAKKAEPSRTFWLAPDVSRIKELGCTCKVEFEQGVNRKIEGVEK